MQDRSRFEPQRTLGERAKLRQLQRIVDIPPDTSNDCCSKEVCFEAGHTDFTILFATSTALSEIPIGASTQMPARIRSPGARLRLFDGALDALVTLRAFRRTQP